MDLSCTYHPATRSELECIWSKNISASPADPRWPLWRREYLALNADGLGRTFAAVIDGEPVGEVTLLLSPECSAIGGRTALADGKDTANINALRVDAAHRGQGHSSRLVACAEEWAAAHGIRTLTIGVDACEARNRAIYTHWGYTRLLFSAVEDGEEVLYYAKEIIP